MKWATIEQADAVSIKSNPQDSVAALTGFITYASWPGCRLNSSPPFPPPGSPPPPLLPGMRKHFGGAHLSGDLEAAGVQNTRRSLEEKTLFQWQGEGRGEGKGGGEG